jgi:hypothetical protein
VRAGYSGHLRTLICIDCLSYLLIVCIHRSGRSSDPDAVPAPDIISRSQLIASLSQRVLDIRVNSKHPVAQTSVLPLCTAKKAVPNYSFTPNHISCLQKITMTAPLREDVSFKTLTGLTLRGWLFPAEKHGPGIILSPGVRNFSPEYAICLHQS